mmetsp:Transcript_14329/g.24387  ORF Transcript_14329/g.24387 Transcript_14329/m.24387 type:complete len:139 (-) Transcript_14329:430-846(-)
MLRNQVQALMAKAIKPQSSLLSLSKRGFSAGSDALEAVEKYSRHRNKVIMYDLSPITQQNWIAPSATVIGEVKVHRFASVWYNAVLRGDINRIKLGAFTCVGENSVLLTAASLPNSMPATLTVGNNVTIGSNCSLYSC